MCSIACGVLSVFLQIVCRGYSAVMGSKHENLGPKGSVIDFSICVTQDTQVTGDPERVTPWYKVASELLRRKTRSSIYQPKSLDTHTHTHTHTHTETLMHT